MSGITTFFGGLYDGDCGLGSEEGPRRDQSRINRISIMERFSFAARQLVTPIPGTCPDIHILDTVPKSDTQRPAAECILTRMDNVVLGVLTSDCLPVLLADKKEGITGTIHLSREMLLQGFTQRVVEAMEDMNASHIEAWLGPCLQSQHHYLSGPAEDWIRQNPAVASHMIPDGAEKCKLDYTAFAVAELQRLGVHIRSASDEDTYSGLYFSLRRRQIDGNAGANLSFISLNHGPS